MEAQGTQGMIELQAALVFLVFSFVFIVVKISSDL